MDKRLFYFLLFVFLQISCREGKPPVFNNSRINKEDSLKLSERLLNVYENDQRYRRLVASIIETYGVNSIEMQELSQKIKMIDSTNLLIVKSIVEKHGWLSSDEIGDKPNAALFLVVQHLPLAERLYFLPAMQLAVKRGAIAKKDFAIFEDRIALDEGGSQIYGTQMGFDTLTKSYYVFPIQNPANVDKRRADVGLAPIAVQMTEWNIKAVNK